MIAGLVQELYMEKPQDALYHYTSLNGVMGIVESGSLQATDIRFFNDTAEMKHTADLLGALVMQREAGGTSNPRLFLQFREWLSHRLTDGHMLYVACFTANGNLLSQWRSYCPTARGVSLGFDAMKVCASATSQSFQVAKCIYDSETQQKAAATVLDAIEYIAKKEGENTDLHKRHPTQSFYDVFEEIETDLLLVAALLKHPSFHEEQEWRVVSSVTTNYVAAPIQYREGLSMLIPFMNFRLPESSDGRLDLQHVFLGPTPNVSGSMTSLSRYLSKKGASPRQGLAYCGIPYRAW